MPIPYALHESRISAGPDDYRAVVRPVGSADGHDLARDIIEQGSTVGLPDILAVTAALRQACERRLAEGFRVNYFGIVDLFPRIRGVFRGPGDAYDPARHRIDVGADPGAKLRASVRRRAQPQKTAAARPAPSVVRFRDLASGAADGPITPGEIGEVHGNRLKFDPAAADEGIFLVPAAGGPALRIPPQAVQRNKPSLLVFLNPPGLSGTYTLEVRARVGRGSAARELRTGRLDAVLTAAAG